MVFAQHNPKTGTDGRMANKHPNQLVISVYGPHAGEDESAILRRKMEDIRRIGFTMWYYKDGHKLASPRDIQQMAFELAENSELAQMWLIQGGGVATKSEAKAMAEFSPDGIHYAPIDSRLSHVTGSRSGVALFISKIEMVSESSIDIGLFADIKYRHMMFGQGYSTQLAKRFQAPPTRAPMKSRNRSVWAICTLRAPYCVFVR